MNEPATKQDTDNEVVEVIRISFDSLENTVPTSEESIGLFQATDKLPVMGVVKAWFESRPPEKMYIGYDKKIYPQYKLVTRYLNPK